MQLRIERPSQRGFSMIEMLMAAFILAIGILGLSMLQAMSLRASRGSRSLATSVQVAEAMMDQVEAEGRLGYRNVAGTDLLAPPPMPATLQYINQAGPVVRTFTIKGRAPNPTATDPLDVNPFFTATLVRSAAAIGATAGGLSLHDYTVTVSFADTVSTSGAPTVIQRNVVLSRRIIHG